MNKAVDLRQEEGESELKGRADRLLTQFRRKTVVNLLRTWRGLKHTALSAFGAAYSPDLPKEEWERLRKQMQECVHGPGGEVSARARAIELGQVYLELSEKGRAHFLALLASDFGVDHPALNLAIETYKRAGDDTARAKAELMLREALLPDTVRIFKLFSAVPDGVKFLVDMREDMLPLAKKHPQLHILEQDLKRLLSSWFDLTLLDLVRIDWNSPAALLEKLIAYEAVHAIRSWNDLKNRLDSDRRCFAFFHHKMRLEPLIFVEVALCSGMADNVQALLDESKPVEDPAQMDTAVFYSISNAQGGLAGISFGNFLIKRVVNELSNEFKNLKHFATLSPIPGFRSWLKKRLAESAKDLLQPLEIRELIRISGKEDGGQALAAMMERDGWQKDATTEEVIRPILIRLCAQYLVRERRDPTTAMDPVAHFHLTNGARVERINWMADSSTNGLKQSLGLMVNYYYKLDEIDANHEAYVGGKPIAASKAVNGLLKV